VLQSAIKHLIYYQFFLGCLKGAYLDLYLFFIFINDIPNTLAHSESYIFADDTKCAKQISKIEHGNQLQQDLNSVCHWNTTWLLLFNKMKLRHFVQEHLEFHIPKKFFMNGNPIESTMTNKFYFLLIYLETPAIVISVLKLTKKLGFIWRLFSTQSVYRKKTRPSSFRSQISTHLLFSQLETSNYRRYCSMRKSPEVGN